MVPGLFSCSCPKRNKPLRFLLISRKRIGTIKADQINILRKQYDAFVEEDRKRKERNEHILDKLDKICLSKTMARYKPNIYLDQRVTFNCTGEPPIKTYYPPTNQPAMASSLGRLPAEINVLAKPLEEAYIINEISKKYILIPKLRSAVSEDYISTSMKQDNDNDTDWKSKYIILDTLKQSEKEEPIQFSPTKKHSESFLDDIPSKEPKYRVEDDTVGITSNHEFAETNYMGPTNDATNRLSYLDDSGHASLVTKGAETESTQAVYPDNIPKLNTNVCKDLKNDAEFVGGSSVIDKRGANGEQNQYQTDKGQYRHPTTEIHEPVAPVTTNVNRDNQQSYVVYSDKHENEDNEKLSPVVDDIRHVEVIDSMKPEAPKPTVDNQNQGNAEKLDYPIDIINIKDFTPAEGVPLVDGVNVNPKDQNVKQAHLAPDQPASKPPAPADQAYAPGANQHSGGDNYVSEPTATAEHTYLPGADNQLPIGERYVSDPITVAEENEDNALENTDQQSPQVDAYDPDAVTSEIEAFEAEQNQMFYNEQGNYPDQDGLGDIYSPETGNYDPALYYTGAQPEAGYPVEINEHEETAQRYDPSYEAQYAGKEYEQYPQQYAEPQQYEQQYGEQQHFSDQQYTEQQNYDEQQYAEQQYGEQQQTLGDPGVITIAQDFVQEPLDEIREQETMEQIEQQLDNEELAVPNQDGSVEDIVDESVLYAQNAGEVATTEPYVQPQDPRLYVAKENLQPSS